MGEIHVFIAASRSLEARKDRLVFHRRAEGYHWFPESDYPEELAFPKDRALIHAVAIDSDGWGWDGVTLGPGEFVNLKALLARWESKGQLLFGRTISTSNIRFALNDSGGFIGDMREAVGGKKVPFVEGDADWGRMLEWERVLVSISKSSPHYAILRNATEAMKMLGGLWAQHAPAKWNGNRLERGFSSDCSYEDRMCDFTDSTLEAVMPTLATIADARDGNGFPNELPPLNESNFRARKRIASDLIGTLDVTGVAIHSIENIAPPADLDGQRCPDGTNYLVSTGKALEFFISGNRVSFEVFRGLSKWGDGSASLRSHYLRNEYLHRSLHSPTPQTAVLGLSHLPDVLDRLVACAKSPINVFAALQRADAIVFASRENVHRIHSGANVLKEQIAAGGFIADKLTVNRGEPGICLNLELVIGEMFDMAVVPAGYVRFLVNGAGTRISGEFPGFARCQSLADEVLLYFVELYGRSVTDWFSKDGTERILRKGKAVAQGCGVVDLLIRDGKRKRRKDDRCYQNHEDAASYFY